MKHPGRIFLAGALAAMLLFKPGFAGTFLQSIGTVVASALNIEPAHAAPVPTPIQVESEPPKQEVVIEEIDPTRMLDERDQKFMSLFDRILERLDRLEAKPAPAPEPVVDPKIQQYREALDHQGQIEREHGYYGDDPLIRKRLGLPPKLPSFEEFSNSVEMDVDRFDRTYKSKFPTSRNM